MGEGVEEVENGECKCRGDCEADEVVVVVAGVRRVGGGVELGELGGERAGEEARLVSALGWSRLSAGTIRWKDTDSLASSEPLEDSLECRCLLLVALSARRITGFCSLLVLRQPSASCCWSGVVAELQRRSDGTVNTAHMGSSSVLPDAEGTNRLELRLLPGSASREEWAARRSHDARR